MLDFKELSVDGIQFELLIREILFSKGMDTYWSGIGPDGGRDLLCTERLPSVFGATTRSWLVQCKHFAHANRSVGMPDLDNIIDSSHQHSVDGFVLASSTYLSSGVVDRLKAIGNNRANRLLTSYLDSALIERALLTPQSWHIAQRFFPVSSSGETWRVNATDKPNHFVVNYKGYIFHLMNRIGSDYDHHFNTIESRISDIESIPFNEGHFLRPRAFWYDDKNGGYSVYLDYMVPISEKRQYSEASIKRALGNWNVLDDGQMYNFDVVSRHYNSNSDHYDRDHYNYYVPYMGSFLVGEGRSHNLVPSDTMSWDFNDPTPIKSGKTVIDAGANSAFDRFVDATKDKLGDAFVYAYNANPEGLDLIEEGSLSAVYETYGHMPRFNSARFVFRGSKRSRVYKFIEILDQGIDCTVSCRDGLTFVSDDGGRAKRDIDSPSERLIFVSIEVSFAETSKDIRDVFNRYFSAMTDRLVSTKI